MKKRPTIAELEAMMDDPTKPKIRLEPDGSITAIKPETETEELVRLRRENKDLIIRLSKANGVVVQIKKVLQEIL